MPSRYAAGAFVHEAAPRPVASRPTEGLMDTLVWLWRLGIVREGRLVLVGLRQHLQKLVERGKVVPIHGGRNHRLPPVIARDEGRIDGPHRGPLRRAVLRLLAEPPPPTRGPAVVDRRIGEQAPDGFVARRV